MKHHNIESWASNIGYIVEKNEQEGNLIYYWHKSGEVKPNIAHSAEEVMNKILDDIKSNFEEKLS
jgi:hypothetical protein